MPEKSGRGWERKEKKMDKGIQKKRKPSRQQMMGFVCQVYQLQV